MTTLQILLGLLGTVSAVTLFALGWAFMAIAKLTDERDDLPCCYRPHIVVRECQGQSGPFCTNCGIWQRSPLDAATTSSPGTMDEGGLERPTEGRSDAA